MEPRVDQVVVFDTARDSRDLRYERTRAVLAKGVLPGTPELRMTGDRQECLELLLANEDHHSLLLCDMTDDHPDVGNVGARLLRTIARNDDLAPQVWRVLWSQHDHPVVITEIEPYAHAFLWYDRADLDGEQLGRAIRQVVREPPSGLPDSKPAFHWFAPRGLTAEQHIERWRTTLQGLLADGRELKRNDEVAIASILRGTPDKVTNERLAAARASVPTAERRLSCASITEFLGRIRGDTRQARDAVFDALISQSQEGIATNVTPDLVERAHAVISAWATRPEALRYKTLLSEGETRLACALVNSYDRHYRALQPERNDDATRYVALDMALADDEVETAFAHPDLADCSQTEERRTETLSYTIGVHNDVARPVVERHQ